MGCGQDGEHVKRGCGQDGSQKRQTHCIFEARCKPFDVALNAWCEVSISTGWREGGREGGGGSDQVAGGRDLYMYTWLHVL